MRPEFLQDFYQRVWIEGDVNAIDQFFVPDSEADGLLPDIALSPIEFQTLVQATLALVESPEIRILRTVEQDDWMSAIVDISCTSRTTGTPVRFHGQVTMRFEDGKIVEAYNNFDLLGFFMQMGALPSGALERFLSGEPMA